VQQNNVTAKAIFEFNQANAFFVVFFAAKVVLFLSCIFQKFHYQGRAFKASAALLLLVGVCHPFSSTLHATEVVTKVYNLTKISLLSSRQSQIRESRLHRNAVACCSFASIKRLLSAIKSFIDMADYGSVKHWSRA
jgi:hypothetical protein